MADKEKIGIVNWFWNNNRGAILTAYASQEVLKELGYEVKIINYMPLINHDVYLKHGRSKNFAEKWLDLTEYCSDITEVRKMNDRFSTFICASDQIWRWNFTKAFQWIYFLKFANASKKIISMAASFGINRYEAPENKLYMTKHLLNRFDWISVREKSGEDILKNQLGIEGTWILDPVFLIDKSKYEKLIESSTREEKEPFIFAYSVNNDENFKKRLEEFQKVVGLRVIKTDGSVTTEDWLYYIKNADYVFSNSFHATCFALMFGTKAFTLKWTNDNCSDRLDALNEITGLWDFCDFENLKERDTDKIKTLLTREIDYEGIYAKLAQFKKFSLNWLKNAIESDKQKKYSENDLFIDSLFEELEEYQFRLLNTERSVRHLHNIIKEQQAVKEKALEEKNSAKIFSLKNEYSNNIKRKVISFMGIRIKIKV